MVCVRAGVWVPRKGSGVFAPKDGVLVVRKRTNTTRVGVRMVLAVATAEMMVDVSSGEVAAVRTPVGVALIRWCETAHAVVPFGEKCVHGIIFHDARRPVAFSWPSTKQAGHMIEVERRSNASAARLNRSESVVHEGLRLRQR
jgi:hypothetical protein